MVQGILKRDLEVAKSCDYSAFCQLGREAHPDIYTGVHPLSVVQVPHLYATDTSILYTKSVRHAQCHSMEDQQYLKEHQGNHLLVYRPF